MSADHEDDEIVELHRRVGVDGRVHVRHQIAADDITRIRAALRATAQLRGGVAPPPGDPTFNQDTAVAAASYERCMTELALWALVLRGEVMLQVAPFWTGARTVLFYTIDNQPIVIGEDAPTH